MVNAKENYLIVKERSSSMHHVDKAGSRVALDFLLGIADWLLAQWW